MAVIDVDQHHRDLVDELIAAAEAYNPGVDKELLARAFRYAATAHEEPDAPLRQAVRPSSVGGREDLCEVLHLDEQSLAAALLHDVIEDGR